MKSVERSRVTWTRAYAKTKAGTPFGRSRMWRVAITIYCVYCDSVKTEEDKGILEHLVGWSFADRPRSLFAKENTKTIPVRTHLKVYILVLGKKNGLRKQKKRCGVSSLWVGVEFS